MKTTRRRGAGFTLIEVMIALLLLVVIMAGAFSTIMILGRAQAATARVDVAQAGARAALELLTRDIEMASAGARGGTIHRATGGVTSVLAVRATDSSVASDRLDLVLVDPSAQATLVAAYAGGTTLTVNDTTGFKAGDVVQLSDLVVATHFTIASVAAGTITVAAPTNALPQSYAPGAYVFRARQVSYFVGTPFGAAIPMLMLDPDGPDGAAAAQPLAEGIEDFQVALGIDANGDGILSSVGAGAGDDEWVHNVSGESAPLSLTGLEAVRITLVARPTSALGGMLGRRPAVENRAAAALPDTYPRRVLRSEIAVRNFNL